MAVTPTLSQGHRQLRGCLPPALCPVLLPMFPRAGGHSLARADPFPAQGEGVLSLEGPSQELGGHAWGWKGPSCSGNSWRVPGDLSGLVKGALPPLPGLSAFSLPLTLSFSFLLFYFQPAIYSLFVHPLPSSQGYPTDGVPRQPFLALRSP